MKHKAKFRRAWRDGAERRYHQLPVDISRRMDLPQSAKLAYAVIENLAQIGLVRWPGLRRIAAEIGSDEKTANRAVEALHAAGLLVWTGRGERFTREYELGPLAPRTLVSRDLQSAPIMGAGSAPKMGAGSAPGKGADFAPPYNPPSKEKGKESMKVSEDGLLIPTSLFILRMKREKRIPVSEKEALYLDTLFGFGVTEQFLWPRMLSHWLPLKHWDFRLKVLQEWAQFKRDCHGCRAYFVGHRGVAPQVHVVEEVKLYGTPAQIAWALGDGSAQECGGQSVEEG